MAYTDPVAVHDPSTGTSPPSAWGDAVNGDIQFLYGAPSCRVYNSAAIAVLNNTLTLLTANSERWDNDGIHSTATNTSRLTCQTAGVYAIWAAIAWDANTTGLREIGVWINGTGLIALSKTTIEATGTGELMQTIDTQWKLAVGDYAEIKVNQTSGGSLNIARSDAWSPEFGMTWVSAG